MQVGIDRIYLAYTSILNPPLKEARIGTQIFKCHKVLLTGSFPFVTDLFKDGC